MVGLVLGDAGGKALELERQRLARAIQHETDHLDGVLFVDRLDAVTRKRAMAEIRAAEWFGDPVPMVKVSPHPLFGKAR